ncbi:hypothetical protein HAX54_034485 [Datura stramonium]|uniref:Uncharacterized protein n=1 Tax=Datura stramonium TaxID=4076 RepID=A0ABS8VDZ8_DATST|nr:hypothetical protein [Datura stramonium]
MPSTQPLSSDTHASSNQPPSSDRSASSSQPMNSSQPKVLFIKRSSQPSTPRGSNETSTSSGVGRRKGISGQKRRPINAIGRAQKRPNNVGFALYHDNRTGIQPRILSERVVIAGSNIINTAPTNTDIGYKPPDLRWMSREAISTFQLKQMRNSKSENL